MFGKKLFQVLRTLDKKEFYHFETFVYSPYFNKHEGIRCFVSFLRSHYPGFDFSADDLINSVFDGDKGLADKELGPYTTYVLRLVDQFFIQEQLNKSKGVQAVFSLREIRTRKLNKIFEKKLQTLRSIEENEVVRTDRYYLTMHEFASEADFYFEQTGHRKKDNNLELKQYFLHRYFLLVKLRDSCEMLIRSRILKVDYENAILENILGVCQDIFESDPVILAYYKVHLMLKNAKPAFFFEAVRTITENEVAFSRGDLKNLYNYFQNFCISRINIGDASFLVEIFKLYQFQLEKSLLLEEEHLSEWHYKNIVTTGIRLGELDWVKGFIEDYKEKLLPDIKENAYRFNLANYHYAAKNYDEVLHLLIHVEYSDIRYNLGSKAILLRTYYDLEEFESLSALADTFRLYLLRNKLMADIRRQGYHNLFRFTKRTAQLRANVEVWPQEKQKKELQKLKAVVEKEESIFNKSWLKEKIEELEKEMS